MRLVYRYTPIFHNAIFDMFYILINLWMWGFLPYKKCSMQLRDYAEGCQSLLLTAATHYDLWLLSIATLSFLIKSYKIKWQVWLASLFVFLLCFHITFSYEQSSHVSLFQVNFCGWSSCCTKHSAVTGLNHYRPVTLTNVCRWYHRCGSDKKRWWGPVQRGDPEPVPVMLTK